MEILWLCLALAFFAAEIITKKYITLWFGVAAATVMVLAFFVPLWYVQVPAFLILSFVYLSVFRRMWRREKKKAKKDSITSSFIGRDAIVVRTVYGNRKHGIISVFGQEIEAKGYRGARLEIDTVVRIIKFSGDIAVVLPKDEYMRSFKKR